LLYYNSINVCNFELVLGISSETEAISSFDELLSLSKKVSSKKEKLKIPERAEYSEFGGMELYVETNR
jgi:hypothetical protein